MSISSDTASTTLLNSKVPSVVHPVTLELSNDQALLATSCRTARPQNQLRVNPIITHCDYYVTRKQRFCKSLKKPGSKCCYAHHVELQLDTHHQLQLDTHHQETLTEIQSKNVTAQDSFPATIDSMRENAHKRPRQQAEESSEDPEDTLQYPMPTKTMSVRMKKRLDDGESEDVRIPCPYNPNHTVWKRKLESHMSKCSDRRFVAAMLPFYRENLHAYRRLKEQDKYTVIRSSENSIGVLSLSINLKKKVENLFAEIVEPLFITAATFPFSSTISVPERQPVNSTEKHEIQKQALVSVLQRMGVLSTNDLTNKFKWSSSRAVIAEFGAGKGGVAALVAQMLSARQHDGDKKDEVNTARSEGAAVQEEVSIPRVVVVDRCGFRRKADGTLRGERCPLTRLRIDIKDLDLAAALSHCESTNQWGSAHVSATSLDATADSKKSIRGGCLSAIGKHLCGAGTDHALSCLAATVQDEFHLTELLLLTCCHHLCRFEHLIPPIPAVNNRGDSDKSLARSLENGFSSLSSDEWVTIIAMTSWATGNRSTVRRMGDRNSEQDNNIQNEKDETAGRNRDISSEHDNATCKYSKRVRSLPFMSREEEVLFGRKCKRLIDAYRCYFLKSLGIFGGGVGILEVVETDVSPENCAIVAWQK